MFLQETLELVKQLQALQVDADAALRLADRIQKRSNDPLTTLCSFEQAHRIRRLNSIPAHAWKNLEIRWAKQAIQEIEQLKAQKGAPASLALACFGIQRPGLKEALAKLKSNTSSQIADPVKKVLPLAGDEDDDLDPDAAAALASLQSEVRKLTK